MVMHTVFFFPSFGCYNENLRLLQRKPQAERYSQTNEMKSNIVRANFEKKFNHVVSTTASVGELFSTECQTNMILKSKQFNTPQKMLVMQPFMKQFYYLVACFRFWEWKKTGKDVTWNTFSHCVWHFVLNKRSVAKVSPCLYR